MSIIDEFNTTVSPFDIDLNSTKPYDVIAYYNSTGNLSVACGLLMVNLLVVCGNLFVLYVLISQRSLHTSTNFIVLSLTISDLFLGDYLQKWIFGEVWCTMWLSLDVLLCTASIYNLLAISFDRYMAVKQPIKYRFISSKRMTKITIAIVWLLSAMLTVPPILFNHFRLTDPIALVKHRNSGFIELTFVMGDKQCTPITASDWYIVFSAMVSFILPMILMVILNISIFCTVSDSTKLTQLPTATSKNNLITTKLTSCDDVQNIMRIHRGGGACYRNDLLKYQDYTQSQRSLNTLKKNSASGFNRDFFTSDHLQSLPSTRKPTMDSVATLPAYTKFTSSLTNGVGLFPKCETTTSTTVESQSVNEKFSISADDSSTETATIVASTLNGKLNHKMDLSEAKLCWLNRVRAINIARKQLLLNSNETKSYHSNISSLCNGDRASNFSSPIHTPTLSTIGFSESPLVRPKAKNNLLLSKRLKKKQLLYSFPKITAPVTNNNVITTVTPPCQTTPNGIHSKTLWYNTLLTIISTNNYASSVSLRSRSSTNGLKENERLLYSLLPQSGLPNGASTPQPNKWSLRTELRVARTIAIVVGCFTACWLPFTIFYILQAYSLCPAGRCIPEWFITFAFWLGYANSAFNPLLYAAFSRDFRSAFRKVLMDRSSSFRTSI